MHCASCATLIQGEMKEIPEILSCDINIVNHTATLDFANQEIPIEQLNEKIQPFGYTLVEDSPDKGRGRTLNEVKRTKKGFDVNEGDTQHDHDFQITHRDMLISIPLIIFCLFLMGRMLGAEYSLFGIPEMPETFHYLITKRILPILTTVFIFTIGRKYLKAVWLYLTRGKATMDTLVGIGTGFAYLFSIFVTLFGERFEQYLDPTRVFYEAVIVVIGFISIGKYMEQRTMTKT
ncbi:MAG: cation transporter [Candidatus Peribacteria bacterium]|jgi:Cu+-exporting ATPase|nr:cation transporter [Candidatus Peribacteria bacterium]